MGDYMASLARLQRRSWQQMLPGHGETVADVAGRLAELAAHRRNREAEVLAALSDRPTTAKAIAARIYREIPAALQAAAARNVLAHLIDLAERNMVWSEDDLTAEAGFSKL